jgi:hypothetical protein
LKAYLIKGVLIFSVLFAFLYWLDQRSLMKPDLPAASAAQTSVDGGEASVSSDSTASKDAGVSSSPFTTKESIKEEAMRLAAEASNTEYRSPSNTNTSGFVPDPQGRLTQEQISRYMNILQITMSRLSSESQRINDNSKALNARYQELVDQNAMSLAIYSHFYFQDLANLSQSVEKARQIHAEILASKNTSAVEYRWIEQHVNQAFYIVANAELKKQTASIKAERLRKLENVTMNDYAEMESTYIAIFANSVDDYSAVIKANLAKTTIDQRFSDYKKSQREEIERAFQGWPNNPIDNEQIRANGQLVLPYKALLLKNYSEYLLLIL